MADKTIQMWAVIQRERDAIIAVHLSQYNAEYAVEYSYCDPNGKWYAVEEVTVIRKSK